MENGEKVKGKIIVNWEEKIALPYCPLANKGTGTLS